MTEVTKKQVNYFLVVRYDCNAFPRLQLLRTRLYDFMEMANTGTQYSPHIRFICHEEYTTKQLSNVIGRFSVNGIPSKYLTKHDGCDSKLIVTVCILQPDTSGKLTRMVGSSFCIARFIMLGLFL